MLIFRPYDEMISHGDPYKTTDPGFKIFRIQQQKCRPVISMRLSQKLFSDETQDLPSTVQ